MHNNASVWLKWCDQRGVKLLIFDWWSLCGMTTCAVDVEVYHNFLFWWWTWSLVRFYQNCFNFLSLSNWNLPWNRIVFIPTKKLFSRERTISANVECNVKYNIKQISCTRVAILYSLRINVFRRTHFVTLIKSVKRCSKQQPPWKKTVLSTEEFAEFVSRLFPHSIIC